MSTTTPARPRPKRPAAAPAIDPRIRERRVAVAREAGRRRLRVVLALLGLVAAAALAVTVAASPLLDVDRIDIRGSVHTPSERLLGAARLGPGVPMATVRAGAVADRLERLPWVAAATVERRWPSRLVIDVVERRPIAAVARRDGRWALVDRTGLVLDVVGVPAPDLGHVHNARQDARVGRRVAPRVRDAARASRAMPKELRALVGGVNITRQGIELALNAGGVVRLGDGRDLDQKLVAARTVLSRVAAARVAVLDVRAPGAPVLLRK